MMNSRSCNKFFTYLISIPAIAAVWVIVIVLNVPAFITAFLTTFSIIIPLAASLYGMTLFGRGGFVREDRFQMMYLLLTIAMMIFAVGEVAIIPVEFIPNGERFVFLVGVVHITAFLPLALGILRYVQRVMKTLGHPPKEVVWTTIIIIPMLITVFVIIMTRQLDLVESILDVTVGLVLAIGFGILSLGLLVLVYIFRRGLLVAPISLLYMASALFFVRALIWIGWAISLSNPLSRLIAIMGYLFLGVSFQIANCMQN